MPGDKYLAQPKDIVYIYDGSWSGFFCCVYESVYSREIPFAIYTQENAQPSLWPEKPIATDEKTAARVRESIPKKISPRSFELVENVYFSCMKSKEIHMLRFLIKAFSLGPKTVNMLGDPDVAPMLKAERHLLGERHLLLGFIRFSDSGGALTASITPKNFILPYIADHFIDRYANEDFMIYDKTHKAALIYQNKQKQIVRIEDVEFPAVSRNEEYYRSLWKQFYNTVAIKARTNPKCRMTHMPKRYWENMIEMEDELPAGPG
jgi:probable DNA metabolism protein